MKKLYTIVIGFWLLISLLGGLIAIQGSRETAHEFSAFESQEYENIKANSWKASIGKIDQYQPAVDENTASEEERETTEQEENTERRQQIESGRLIGIVLSTPPKAMLLIPGTEEPVAFKLGQTWLEPWKLSEIGQDSVVWTNQDTGELTEQTLFM